MIIKKHPNFKRRYNIFIAISFFSIAVISYKIIANNEDHLVPVIAVGLFLFIILTWLYKHTAANWAKCPQCSSRLIVNPHIPDRESSATCQPCQIKWNLEVIFKRTQSSDDDYDHDWSTDD